jgi:hypothetical protein
MATPPPLFNVNALGPTNYYDHDGPGAAGGVAVEGTPEVKAGFLERLGHSPFQLSGFIDESSDRYAGPPTNSDKLDATVRIDMIGSEEFWDRDQLIPYVSYSPQQTFAPTFSKGQKVTQDWAAGVNKLWDFLPSGIACDERYGCYPAWELGFQLTGQHRAVDSGAGSNALVIAPSVKWSAVDRAHFPYVDLDKVGKLSTSIGVTVTGRWYAGLGGVSERTWTMAPIFTAAWSPPSKWFGKVATYLGSPELDFQAAYNDQQSTVHKDTFQQLVIGPVIKGGWTF